MGRLLPRRSGYVAEPKQEPPIICATAAIDPMCFEWMPAPKQGRISEQVSLEHLGGTSSQAAVQLEKDHSSKSKGHIGRVCDPYNQQPGKEELSSAYQSMK